MATGKLEKRCRTETLGFESEKREKLFGGRNRVFRTMVFLLVQVSWLFLQDIDFLNENSDVTLDSTLSPILCIIPLIKNA